MVLSNSKMILSKPSSRAHLSVVFQRNPLKNSNITPTLLLKSRSWPRSNKRNLNLSKRRLRLHPRAFKRRTPNLWVIFCSSLQVKLRNSHFSLSSATLTSASASTRSIHQLYSLWPLLSYTLKFAKLLRLDSTTKFLNRRNLVVSAQPSKRPP